MYNMNKKEELTKPKSESKHIIFKVEKVPKSTVLDDNYSLNFDEFSTKKDKKQRKKQEENNENDVYSQRSRYSLTKISDLVYRFIKERDKTTIYAATQYVVNYLNKKYKDEGAIVKNIQRRVYDAINVMVAINLLTKKKNTIELTENYPKNEERDAERLIESLRENLDENLVNLHSNQEEEMSKLSNEIDVKQQKLSDLYIQLYFNKKYSQLNNEDKTRRVSEKEQLKFPCYLIQNDPSQIHVYSGDNRHIFLSEAPILMQSPKEIMTKLVANDLNRKIIEFNALRQANEKTENFEDLNVSLDTLREMKTIDNEAKRMGLNIFEATEKAQNLTAEEAIFNYLGKSDFFKEIISKNTYPEKIKKKRRRSSSFMLNN